jgi:hypothetical protein
MDKFKLEADDLEKKLYAPKMIKLADVKDQVRKVAFDVVTFRNNPEVLWKIIPGDDGEYIVANYPVPDDKLISQSSTQKTAWSIETDRLNKIATIFYHNTPITNIDMIAAKISDPEDFKVRAPIMLQKNANLVKKMMKDLDESYKRQILNLYPELQ